MISIDHVVDHLTFLLRHVCSKLPSASRLSFPAYSGAPEYGYQYTLRDLLHSTLEAAK